MMQGENLSAQKRKFLVIEQNEGRNQGKKKQSRNLSKTEIGSCQQLHRNQNLVAKSICKSGLIEWPLLLPFILSQPETSNMPSEIMQAASKGTMARLSFWVICHTAQESGSGIKGWNWCEFWISLPAYRMLLVGKGLFFLLVVVMFSRGWCNFFLSIFWQIQSWWKGCIPASFFQGDIVN